jgi:hypothetical protein
MKFGMFGMGTVVSLLTLAMVQHASGQASAMNVSPAVGKPLAGAQKLMQASPPDYKSALDMVHTAQAVPNRTPTDDYFINQFLGQIAAATKDNATAAARFETVADSPMLDQDTNKAALLQNALILSTAASHYRKAISYGEKLSALGPLKHNLQGYLAVDYYNIHDDAHARDYAQKALDGAKAAGDQPDPNATTVLAGLAKSGTRTVVRKSRKHH